MTEQVKIKKRLFRYLRADEIQVRPTDTATRGKATLLLFKDARVDANILDETYGPFGWQKEFFNLNDVTYCRIGLRDPISLQWVWKSDAGSNDNNFEQEKGTASDATKRAGFVWGIGRELYDTPRIRVNCPDSYYNNEGSLTMRFKVSEIEFEEETGKCLTLEVQDRFGNVVYSFRNGQVTTATETPAKEYTKDMDGVKEFVSDRWKEADADGKHLLSAFYNDCNVRPEDLAKYGVLGLWRFDSKDVREGRKAVVRVTPAGVDQKPMWILKRVK